eukprot:7475865-Pyramimonas_sp.AAC.1
MDAPPYLVKLLLKPSILEVSRTTLVRPVLNVSVAYKLLVKPGMHFKDTGRHPCRSARVVQFFAAKSWRLS